MCNNKLLVRYSISNKEAREGEGILLVISLLERVPCVR